jgi:hypothetical protein
MPLATGAKKWAAAVGAGIVIAVLLALVTYNNRIQGKSGPLSGIESPKATPAATTEIKAGPQEKQRRPQAGKKGGAGSKVGEGRKLVPEPGFPWAGGLHENEVQRERLADLKWARSPFSSQAEPEKKAAR